MAEDRSKDHEENDIFDNLLDLEAQFHSEGYDLGVTDGSRAGRIEGRIFGLEKGFEKFLEMGRLQGRAAAWRSAASSSDPSASGESEGFSRVARNERLNKHVSRLSDLTDIETLSTENSEDAVADFDDRLKDARAKATLISRILGEDDSAFSTSEDPSRPVKHGLRMKSNDSEKKTNEMEDFVGLPRGNLERR